MCVQSAGNIRKDDLDSSTRQDNKALVGSDAFTKTTKLH